jgi:hypothetical protein
MSETLPAPQRLLVVFTRWPEPGTAKTRLMPALGAGGAAALQRSMTEHALARLERLAAMVEVRHAGGDEALLRTWLGGGWAYAPQGGGDIGARMQRAVAGAFAAGVGAVVLVGTDCPEVGAGDVNDAFAALERADAVFGPARDGGYWLVGLRRSARDAARVLFTGLPWGAPEVLRASLEAAARAGLSCRLLRTLADVDRPEDLAVWERARRELAAGELLSVVIPTLDEAEDIAALVDRVRRGIGVEVVVADGGSTDGTPRIAAAHGARVVACARGRAAQLNAGAGAASGSLLLFLHADTRLPEGFEALIRETLSEPSVAGGAFAFMTDSPLRSLRVVASLANVRSARLGIVYGDQGIFARRAAFEAAGGFPDQPILEDWEFVRRLKRRGGFLLRREPAVTSARRWRAHGVVRTTLANVLTAAGYLVGAPPDALARRYQALLRR